MKYAVIVTGGKQYQVAEGETIKVEKLEGKPKKAVKFSDVLLVVSDKVRKIGTPKVAGASVTAEIVAQKKAKKIRVAKFRAKSRYRLVRGHRQNITELAIKKIT
ncbi:MAG: 50S ribosomal protein L21 [Candidatus Beckwithbacteria bacterium GW2011_GWB1_47_15]|uniref:Large ribosomal subunit protein bL21 n=1 Tax=Candidatus Beckwithbacteria bacterium GW2011_GWB1_47_15 TaxID=1618371 RepID=A0A0G1RX14_9BACT|nr:MAG: 50S ribosomal protein L21, large subunit ribosomal protein L21 [Candidatus Beckwithbacteria bacterium GW2011_GWC1_49_16]KKU35577.1 MAG: 50S ribosomal protein L21 [Candidatus Beckwithbacteria bacterium GW2011_GWA1_46_30]KKU61631.1 MAG: 50S ribosomal protein L21 [Candidatus Beckwithbacteria bacterium GW2011_GWB1_47_15]KKU72134.1 MAG: 50S ribosomal protein L21 [Candidatus Beckwithbacteria bacterium GW2011_GWA2_47_25]KKW04759.1 MAG: 50S ribosomal protein L21 [Candidatus Beckwithbacteria bac